MSSDSNAIYIATYESYLVDNRVLNAAAALIVFEHFATIRYEIDFLRRQTWSTATWIFLLNRYLLLANLLFALAPMSAQTCGNTAAVNFLGFLANGAVPDLPGHAFSILRSFALLQNHLWRSTVTCILIVLTLVITVLDAILDFTSTWAYIDDPILGSACFGTGVSLAPSISERVDWAATAAGVSSAAIVLIVTITSTVRQVREAHALGVRTDTSKILLRDGSMFFLLILLVDIFAATVDISGSSGVVAGAAIPLVIILPRILLTRFIINLGQIDESSTTNDSMGRRGSRLSDPVFRPPTMNNIVGNLGQPLDFEEHHIDDDEYDEPEPFAPADSADAVPNNEATEDAYTATLADVESMHISYSSGVGAAGTGEIQLEKRHIDPVSSV